MEWVFLILLILGLMVLVRYFYYRLFPWKITERRGDRYMARNAVAKSSNQKRLERMALLSPLKDVNRAAVDKITNQASLSRIACAAWEQVSTSAEHMNSRLFLGSVQLSALRKITDGEIKKQVLKSPEWQKIIKGIVNEVSSASFDRSYSSDKKELLNFLLEIAAVNPQIIKENWSVISAKLNHHDDEASNHKDWWGAQPFNFGDCHDDHSKHHDSGSKHIDAYPLREYKTRFPPFFRSE
jgi:hypothetical protein